MGGKEGLQRWPCPHVHTGTHVEVGVDKEGETAEEASSRAVRGRGEWERGEGERWGEGGRQREREGERK